MANEKTLPATQRKLEQARDKGQIAKSAQVVACAAFAGALGALLLTVDPMIARFAAHFETTLQLAANPQGSSVLVQWLFDSLRLLLVLILPLLAGASAAALLGGFLQTRGLIAFGIIAFKPEKLNPAANIKQLLSLKQMLDLLKKTLEATVLTLIAAVVVWKALPALLRGVFDAPGQIARDNLQVLAFLCGVCLLFWVLISVLDYAIQRFGFLREQRMDLEDLKREHKDSNGDPHVKQARTALQREAALTAGNPTIKGARALIVNPVHVAVALGQGMDEVPVVLTKALDQQALAFRAEAERLGIPIFEDVPLARALYREIGIGAAITPPFFEAVAQVYVWLERLAQEQQTT